MFDNPVRTLISIFAVVLFSATAFPDEKDLLSDEIIRVDRLQVSFKRPNGWFSPGEREDGLPQGSWTPGKGSGGQLEVGGAQVAQC